MVREQKESTCRYEKVRFGATCSGLGPNLQPIGGGYYKYTRREKYQVLMREHKRQTQKIFNSMRLSSLFSLTTCFLIHRTFRMTEC